ncbi:hypothetical protein CLIB1444_08S02454 [[Candida] jaroonii]|uniref:Uncharacterized protein n=1 Tax=[Candida] jaroonii TaxID=467808 RepID=A0ACA9YBG8_9ASCO|nr:hypothetical protein CLIB1444_08S02454 [[Candida] jaroonii]
MSVGKIKNNITHLGSSIGTSINNASNNVTYSVKSTIKKKKYDSDDELIKEYQEDIKRSIKALSFISKQIHIISNVVLPKLFKSHMKSVELFAKLIGANALQFKGIDDYYRDFDISQQQQEIPMIHPKESMFEIESLNEELYNYMVTIDKLTLGILNDWDLFYQENKLRIIEMKGYLKDSLKLIFKRNQKQDQYETLYKKLDKIMKKTTPLDDKEQTKMNNLEKELREVKKIYEALDERTRTNLPHVFVNLEEFIDSISKILFFKQLDTYKSFYKTLSHFSEYYGFLSSEGTESDYQHIVDQWENSMTPVRLQIETFITIIHDKNPELLNEEIDDEDKTSKSAKMWNNLSRKMTDKSFKLKAKDHKNGLFNGHLIVDQLDAFLEYNNPTANISETYLPTKPIRKDEVMIPDIEVSNVVAPPLPPRTNTAGALIAPPTPRIGLPVSLPGSPMPSTPMSTNYSFERTQSITDIDSVESASIRSDDDDSDFEDKESMENLSSVATSRYVTDNAKEKMSRHLAKIYNSSKNQIKESPIHIDPNDLTSFSPKGDAFDRTSTITHRLNEFDSFYHKVNFVESAMNRKTLVAKHNFMGEQPGDLSFKEGDEIEIIFEFNPTKASSDGIWSIGVIQNQGSSRIGMVPSNYF